MKTGDDRKGNVVPFRKGSSGGASSSGEQVIVPYYPDKLKTYYLDLLLRYKNQRAKERGRGYGWQSIRNEIMASEDEKLVQARRKQKINVDVDRPRSEDFNTDDLKGWYRRGNSHLPTDFKFQYIDSFIRGLRLEGRIEAIERVISEARREYFRESITQFYRPDLAFPKQIYAEAKDPRNEVHALMNRAVFVGVCQKGYEGLIRVPDHGAPTRFVVILLCGEFKRCAVPVELFACFLDDDVWNEAQSVMVGQFRSIGPDLISRCKFDKVRVISIFSGFFVPESLGANMGLEVVAGSLFTAKPSDAFISHQGLPHHTPRYYEPKVHVFNAHGGAILILGTPVDALLTLGLVPIVDSSELKLENQSGLVKCRENIFLQELRAKFEIGYRLC